MNESFHEKLEYIWQTIIQLNMFKSSMKTTAIDQIHQRWSTRIYIVLLAFVLLFLTLYTWLTVQAKIVQVKTPSLSTVEYLQKNAVSLQCPCTSLSTSYNELIRLKPTYHQICSSDFVSSTWIDGLNRMASQSMTSLYYADFRYTSPIFQLLKSMCDLANDTIVNAMLVFGQTQLITPHLLEPMLFQQQMQSAIGQFKRATPNVLLHLLRLTRNITYTNQFLSGSYANFFITYSLLEEYAQTNVTLGIYGASSVLSNGTVKTCSCANDIECGRNAALYTGPSGQRKIIFIVPGFYSRCFPVESLLPSTLECFYDSQPCLEQMANVTNQTFFMHITRLNASQTSRFTIQTTINDLLAELFVESWSSELLYSSYFAQCQPVSCSHTVVTQKNTLEIVTTVAGLIGGLSVALRLLVPNVIAILMKIYSKCTSIREQSTSTEREFLDTGCRLSLSIAMSIETFDFLSFSSHSS
jgi:hypothetical protein